MLEALYLEFENFELYIEWKIPAGGNSGIFYHIAEGYGGIPEVAPEYQLIDDLGYTDFHDITEYNKSIGIEVNPQDLQPLQSTAADYAMHVPDATKKQLNPMDVLAHNSRRVKFCLKVLRKF